MGAIISLIGFLLVLGFGGALLPIVMFIIYRADGGKMNLKNWYENWR